MRAGESPRVTVEGGNIIPSVSGVPRYRLPLAEIADIAAYKRDEITTDLICFDVKASDGKVWTFHEDIAGFDDLVAAVERLPGFFAGWRGKVVLPAFEPNRTVVYVKPSERSCNLG